MNDPNEIKALAALLVNGITVVVGRPFPCGWDAMGDRMYVTATPLLLREAFRLSKEQLAEDER